MSAYEYFRPTKNRIFLVFVCFVVLIFLHSFLGLMCTYTASTPDSFSSCTSSYFVQIMTALNVLNWPLYVFMPLQNIISSNILVVLTLLLFILWIYFLGCSLQLFIAKMSGKKSTRR